MMNRIKKALIVTLASISIIGNVTSAPVQARTFPDVAKNAPITKVIDCNDLTEEMLTTRADHSIMYIERIIGKVTDNEKNGIVLNPPVDGGYYISYASVDDAESGILGGRTRMEYKFSSTGIENYIADLKLYISKKEDI